MSSTEYYRLHPDKKKEHDKKYYQKHKAEIAEKFKSTYKEYKADPIIWRKILDRNKKWRKDNREQMNKIIGIWSKNHPEKKAEYKEKRMKDKKRQARFLFVRREAEKLRRARKKGGGTFRISEWRKIKKDCGYSCVICGAIEEYLIAETGIGLTIDHIIPISKGGSNTKENIQPLCMRCNTLKNNKLNYAKSK